MSTEEALNIESYFCTQTSYHVQFSSDRTACGERC